MRRLAPLLAALAVAGCGSTPRAPQRAPTPRAAPPAQHASPSRHRAYPAIATQRAELSRLRAIGRPIYCGGGRHRVVALTFDDGPGVYTHLALKELRRARAHATFFLVSKSIRRFPHWPPLEARAAAIGDHTATHPLLTALAHAQMVREVAGGRRAAQHAAHVRVRLFRPPYGAFNAAVTQTAARLGMVEILWSIDSGDAISGDFHAISARVRRAMRPGAIVLMHENHGQTIRALRSLLPWLKRHHYRTASVPELLAADPPSSAQLAEGARACPSERAAFILGANG